MEFTKNVYRRGLEEGLLKGELGKFADLRGALTNKRQCGVFYGSVDTQCTVC